MSALWPLPFYFAVGTALGAAYFGSLWWNAKLLAMGGRARTAVALMVGRFAVLAGVLTLASLQGARVLLIVVFGLLVARAVVLRGQRRMLGRMLAP